MSDNAEEASDVKKRMQWLNTAFDKNVDKKPLETPPAVAGSGKSVIKGPHEMARKSVERERKFASKFWQHRANSSVGKLIDF